MRKRVTKVVVAMAIALFGAWVLSSLTEAENEASVVTAQESLTSVPSAFTTEESLSEVVPDKEFVYTPAHFTEDEEEAQFNVTLRKLAEKYRILDVDEERGTYHTSFGDTDPHTILRVRIVVAPK